jgi:hypothetical protein
MTTCEACGTECPEGAAYCGACGHQLGQRPQEPLVVNVRVVNSWWDGCIGCVSWAVGIAVIMFLVAWLFSC